MTPKPEKVTINEVVNENTRAELAELLAERAKWVRIAKEAKEMGDSCSEMIKPMLADLGITNILAADDQGCTKQFIMQGGVNATIKRKLLIDAGIDPELIDQCTDHTSYTSIQVRNYKV